MLKSCRAAELTEDEAGKAVALLHATWPVRDADLEARVRQLLHGDRAEWMVFTAWDRGDLLAHAAIFRRRIVHDRGDLVVMGLAGVCVAEQHRGRGHGRRVVAEAFRRVDASRYPVALFQTEVPSFYAGLGAVTVDNAFCNSRAEADPDARPWWDPHVMIYPDFPAWPSGPIDLNGPGY